jgi:hypothetical protein
MVGAEFQPLTADFCTVPVAPHLSPIWINTDNAYFILW